MTRFVKPCCAVMILLLCGLAFLPGATMAQVAGTNVNMVSGQKWPTGDPFLQRQNEPSMAVSTRNPLHILAGANDYRSVDLELVLSGGAETGDSWLGIFKSFDGGLTWQSTLLPGCPQTVPQCKDSGALNGYYPAGADPVVRAGTNGMFYYAGLAFQRATSPTTASTSSTIFVARYNDLNNNENLDPITYIDTHIVATGNSTQFLDKPAMAVDIPRYGALTCSFTAHEPGAGPGGGSLAVHQSFAAGNVYLAYTDFLAATKDNATPTHLMITHSKDCGVSWSTPVQLNTGTTTSQGAAIGINPTNGHLFVAWRQFGSAGVNNAIMVVESSNAGKSFSRPTQASKFVPFDQGTTGTSFRTNAYPSITVDGSGNAYVAFSARGLSASGDARVVVVASEDECGSWPGSVVVDNPAENALTNPSGRGHQIMPAIAFANGKLTILYYDLRLDHQGVSYTPSSTSPTGYVGTLVAEGELATSPPNTGEVFNNYIDDYGLQLRRHTLDLRAMEFAMFPSVAVGPSVLVSKYDYGCCLNPNTPDIEQFKFNVPNLPLFAQGSAPFLGDYIDVVPSPAFVLNGTSWVYNTKSSSNPLFHATWTDNRDVVPPADGNWSNYTPAIPYGTPSVFETGKTVKACTAGQEGMRNQNIYTAQITGGLVVGAPGNTKTLGSTMFNGASVPFQRAFPVVAQNVTALPINVRFSIANQPTGGNASFLQYSQLTTVDVTIPALSSVSRSVFVTSTNPTASVTVSVTQINAIGGTTVANGLTAATVLNPDITNPAITNPAITNPAITNPAITNYEVTDPAITNPAITNPAITNPAITNPAITNPAITNPAITNPAITNPAITNPAITNPAITNASATNPAITNPAITNPAITNPAITNPAITNPAITNGSIQDVTYAITNNGNTTSAYTVRTATGTTVPGGIVLQLILSKLYQTPGANNCTLGAETHLVTVANITGPKLYGLTDPQLGSSGATNSTPNEASVTLVPGETAYITLRVVNPSPSTIQFNPVTAITPVSVPQAVNTTTVLSNPGVQVTPPIVYPQLTITSPSTLSATDQGNPGYTYQLKATGGKPGTDTWSIIGGALPNGMNLSSSGLISGQTVALGPNSVTVQVMDLAGNMGSKTFSIPVSNLFQIQTHLTPNDAVVGQSYVLVPFTTTGGTAPFIFAATGLPPGLTINSSTGQISGSPTAPNVAGYAVQVTSTDSALPPNILPLAINIKVGSVIAIGPSPLPGGTIGAPYSAQLTATGGIGSLLFTITQLPSGGLLDSNGAITITNPQSSSVSFTASVHDQANPFQFQSANYTVNFAALAQILKGVTLTPQPGNSIGGQLLAGSPIQAVVGDSLGNPIANALVTFSIVPSTGCSTATLGGTLTQTSNGSGVATFNDLTIDHGQTGYRLNVNGSIGTQTVNQQTAPFNLSGYCETGSMLAARHNHMVINLPNGKVLITGGAVNPDSTGALASAELYDPTTHTFTNIVPGMNVARVDHAMTLLSNGTVLITGGFNDTSRLSTAEVFDPTNNTFTLLAGQMSTRRAEHTATLLANGKVLIAGGTSFGGATIATAEIFDPGTSTFTISTHAMIAARQIHHADLLANGLVLISGGFDTNNNPLASAEIYDPMADTFAATGSMATARGNHASALLYNGKVLVAGGLVVSGATLIRSATAEVYDPAANTFSVTGSMTQPRGQYFAFVLGDGSVFISGGGVLPAGTNADIYDPVSGTFSATANFTAVQAGLRDGLLPDGTVLLASGLDINSVVMPNSEIYYPVSAPAGITVTTSSAQTALQNHAYALVLLEYGGVGRLTWSLASGSSLPPGISLSPGGVLSGTPTVAGSYNFTVQVTDSSAVVKTGTLALSLVVVGPLTFVTTALPNAPTSYKSPAVVTLPYAAPIQTSGGAGGATSYSIISGNLPASVTLNSSSGLLSSSAVTDAPGTYNFTVQVVSAGPPSSTATQAFTLTVVPFFTAATPNTLSEGMVGVAYLANINSAGGVTPFAYQYVPATNSTIPPGLSVNTLNTTTGQVSGTPTTAGTFTFSVQGSDSSVPSQAYYEAFTLTIAPAAGPVPANVSLSLQPGNSVGGQLLAGSPFQASVRDVTGAPIANFPVTANISPSFPGCSSATLGGTLTQNTDASGVATFTDLMIDRGQIGYQLDFVAGPALQLTSPITVNGFCATGNLNNGRAYPTATLLPSGEVLIAGGQVISGTATNASELFNPATGTFASIAGLNSPRMFHTATLLNNGTVLIAGGAGTTGTFATTAEIFNPTTGTYTNTLNNPNSTRIFHTATLLPDGTVLIAGGLSTTSGFPVAEIYDPVAQTFTTVGAMNSPHVYHSATLLANGKVLIASGLGTLSAELYDPVAKTFANTGNLNAGRQFHTATLLNNGQVLIAGGLPITGTASVGTAELYDPVAGTFSFTTGNLNDARGAHTATLLTDGTVVLTGGYSVVSTTTSPVWSTAETYNPATSTFSRTGSLISGRAFDTGLLLNDGSVLIAGGFDISSGYLGTAEIYYSTAPLSPLAVTTNSLSASPLQMFNTGVNASGALVAAGSTDPNYTITSSPTGAQAATAQYLAGTWVPNDSISQWIAPSVGSGNLGDFLFQTTFSLAGIDPATAKVSGTWGTDNEGTIFLNGVNTGITNGFNNGGYGFTSLTPFTITSGFVSGPNTLVFDVRNDGGPSGLRVQINGNAQQSVLVNQPYVQLLQEQGGVGQLRWSLASGSLPPGITLTPAGILIGTPTGVGLFTFAVTVVDSSSPQKSSTSGNFTLTVSLPVTPPLSIPPATLPVGVQAFPGQPAFPYSAQIQTSGGNGGALTYSVISGSLPASVSLNSSTGALTSASITDAVGVYQFTIQASSAGPPVANATQSFTFYVVPFFAGTTPNTIPAGTIGVAYTQALTSAGGTPSFTYQLLNSTGNALPPGLSITSTAPTTAQLSGTPTVAGTYIFFIQVTDSSTPAQSYTEQLTITVN